MRPIIVFANQKGGVGKSSTASAVTEGLRRAGLKVLAVDCDFQGNMSRYRGTEGGKPNTPTVDFVRGTQAVANYDGSGADVVGTPALEAMEGDDDKAGRPPLPLDALRTRAAETMDAGDYDACVMDTHPDTSLPSLLALGSATHVVVPIQPEADALAALLGEAERDRAMSEATGRGIATAALVTMYNAQSRLHREVVALADEKSGEFGYRLLSHKVSRTVSVATAREAGVPVYDTRQYGKQGIGYQYARVTEEIWEWATAGKGAM